MRPLHLAPAALVLTMLLAIAPRAAADCATPVSYWRDSTLKGIDLQPPSGVRIRGVKVKRAVEPVLDDQFYLGESCSGSGLGRIEVRVDPATDDRSAIREIGYIVEHVRGRLPGDLELPPQPLVLSGSDRLLIPAWTSDDDELFDFHLRLVPIDTAGNRGPPSESFHVYDEGVGCAAAGGGISILGAALACLALPRRRQARRARRRFTKPRSSSSSATRKSLHKPT